MDSADNLPTGNDFDNLSTDELAFCAGEALKHAERRMREARALLVRIEERTECGWVGDAALRMITTAAGLKSIRWAMEGEKWHDVVQDIRRARAALLNPNRTTP